MKRKYYFLVIILSIIFSVIVFTERKLSLKMAHMLNKYFSPEDIIFINENNIDAKDIEPYLSYKKFDIFKYYQYEEVRKAHGFTYLESLNYVNNPNYYRFYHEPQKALFLNTDLVLVNKCHFLDNDYIPPDLKNVGEYNISYIVRQNEVILLRSHVLLAYVRMYEEAKEHGINLMIFSGYRSYDKQRCLYNFVYDKDDTVSARPGFSEHQSGYAIDISQPEDGLTEYFETSLAYEWLINNCHNYGFILRFPRGKEDKTGYSFEPWHFRYVGNIAKFIFERKLTLEEYIFSYLEI